MRSVIDTNIVVSGLISPAGPCAQIIELVVSGDLEACVDERIEGEYEAVLRRPALRIPEPKTTEFIDAMRTLSYWITPAPLKVILPDPTDLPFLEVAAAAEAVLVTGNLRHFPKKSCGAVTVVGPAEFVLLFRRPLS